MLHLFACGCVAAPRLLSAPCISYGPHNLATLIISWSPLSLAGMDVSDVVEFAE